MLCLFLIESEWKIGPLSPSPPFGFSMARHKSIILLGIFWQNEMGDAFVAGRDGVCFAAKSRRDPKSPELLCQAGNEAKAENALW